MAALEGLACFVFYALLALRRYRQEPVVLSLDLYSDN
jgi:hypothetical protein